MVRSLWAWMRSNSRPSGARTAQSLEGLASYLRARARRSRTETHRAAACRVLCANGGTAMGQKMDPMCALLGSELIQAHLAQATLSSVFHVPCTLSMASIDPTPEEIVGRARWRPNRGRISCRFVSSTSWLHVDGARASVVHDFCY